MESTENPTIKQRKPRKPRKPFTEYYADPEYKQKHLAKSREKVECECGVAISRGNMSAHKKTLQHEKRMNKLNIQTNQQDSMKQKIQEFETMLNTMKAQYNVA
jgi:hypothetical protein